jgi:hypothetical protein
MSRAVRFLRGVWSVLILSLLPLMLLGLSGYWLVLYAAVVLAVVVAELTIRLRQGGILRE